jgi:hypothetical protein
VSPQDLNDMAIALPQFEDSFCLMCGICSHFETASSSAVPLPEEDLDLTASYNSSLGKAMLHLVWERESKHLHLDAALRSAFGKRPPKVTTRLPAFQKALAQFEGITVRARLHGYFIVPLASLPPTGGLIFAGNSAIRLQSGKSEIEFTGATIRFHKAKIDRIKWDLVGEDNVALEVHANRDLRVSDSLLTDAFETVNGAASRYILGKKTDDKKNA